MITTKNYPVEIKNVAIDKLPAVLQEEYRAIEKDLNEYGVSWNEYLELSDQEYIKLYLEKLNKSLATKPKAKPKSPTLPKFKKGDRVKNNDGKKGTIYDVFERTSGVTYSVNWDGSRIGQAGIAESSLKKLAKVTKEDVKKVTKAGATVRKAKASRKATAKPRVKVAPKVEEKPKATAKPKSAAKPKFKVGDKVWYKSEGKEYKAEVVKIEPVTKDGVQTYALNKDYGDNKTHYVAYARETEMRRIGQSEKPKGTAKPKAATKPKTATPKNPSPKPKATAKPKAEQTPKVVTHIETPEHKQIKRFLGIRTKETKQLAMTAYRSLQKDITERKIRKTSPQADIIKAIQKSYYQYLINETSSLLVPENILKDAKGFVGSQKPSEIVELVKRFIRFTGVSPTEKQIKEYLKDADKAIKAASDNAPYLDELQSILKSLKTAKVGDTIIADNVGLSGLKANKVKIRK